MTTRLMEMEITTDLDAADYIFVFDDFTKSQSALPVSEKILAKSINHRIHDISKKNVGDIFRSVFGYGIAIDPIQFSGPAVRKSDINGTHDGVIVACPIKPTDALAGHAYQRLIDTSIDDETCEEYRTTCVYGKVAIVFHKYKSLANRFGTTYLKTDLKTADDVFTKKELNQIFKFCEVIGLDYGAVDILRDKNDGRIYIVDVNKTCMPVLSLTLKDQLEAQKRVVAVFQDALERLGGIT